MQPFSRVERALEVKSSTQEVKQCSTRPPKACKRRNKKTSVSVCREVQLEDKTIGGGETYAHELFNLALLHALLKLALLGL